MQSTTLVALTQTKNMNQSQRINSSYLFFSQFSKLPNACNSEADRQDIGGADGESRVVAVVRLALTRLHVAVVGVALLLPDVYVFAARAGYLSS